MKKVIVILLFLHISLALAIPVAAAERTYTYEPRQDNVTGEAAELLEKALPESMSGVADMAKDTVINGGKGGLDGRFIFSELIKTVKNEITGPLQVFFSLIFLVVAAAVFKTLSAAVRSGGVASAFTLCSSLCFCVAVLFPLEKVVNSGAALIEEINAFVLGLLPLFTSLYAAGGNVACAAYASSGVYLLTSLIENVFLHLLLPLARTILAVILTASVCTMDMSGIVKAMKDFFTTAIAFFMMINSAVYTFGNHIAAAGDSVAMRTVRFAAGSFIPVVGGAVGEALRTVAGGLSVIKAGVGWASCAVLMLMLLPPLISALFYRTAFELAAAAARLCSLQAEARLLDGAATVCGLICALMAASSVLFLLAVTVFVKTAVA
ncbi:MAG: hypothetical protein IJN63_03505 [Clostridia bacterium]|nr:hypothetical protein [Clostridia bacterium]